MLTLLADAMFTATLARRGSEIPENLKVHADHYTPKRRKTSGLDRSLDPYRQLW